MNAANTENIMKVRARVTIAGQRAVQSVFFRSKTRRVANAYGVTGWVRSLEDGRVEAVFERDKESVNGLEEFCRKRPPAERVECRRLLGKIFRQFWRFSSKMRLGVCSLETLNSFL